MNYRAFLVGQEHTMADEIFDNEMTEKYETGDQYYVELYEMINKELPDKVKLLDLFTPSSIPVLLPDAHIESYK